VPALLCSPVDRIAAHRVGCGSDVASVLAVAVCAVQRDARRSSSVFASRSHSAEGGWLEGAPRVTVLRRRIPGRRDGMAKVDPAVPDGGGRRAAERERQAARGLGAALGWLGEVPWRVQVVALGDGEADVVRVAWLVAARRPGAGRAARGVLCGCVNRYGQPCASKRAGPRVDCRMTDRGREGLLYAAREHHDPGQSSPSADVRHREPVVRLWPEMLEPCVWIC
jgi:hypothetical protein